MILADAPIVVSFKVSNLIFFINRIGLQIQARRINMSSIQAHTLFQRSGAKGGHGKGFATVDKVNLVAGLVALS